MTSDAVLKLAFGVILLVIMFGLAAGAKRTVSIGTLLVIIPFQIIDTRYASSSILLAYLLAMVMLIRGDFRLRMMLYLSLIVLSYLVSLTLAGRALLVYHVIFTFQFFSCIFVFLLAYNFSLLVDNERTVINILLATNVLALGYCALQMTAGPGERFVPLGIQEFMFNLNRDPSDPRLVGPFDNPGSTAGYFTLMTLVCGFEILFSTGRRRLLVWGITGLNLIGLVATGNRAGFIVLLGMSPLLLYAYRKELGVRRIVSFSVGGAAALALAGTIAVAFTDFDRLFYRLEFVTETEGGVPTTRAETWPIAIEKIKRHPWFGEGPYFNTAETAEHTGQMQVEFEEGGGLDTAFDTYPHSLYLYLLRTVGVFGLLTVVGFFVHAWFVLSWASRRKTMGGYQSAFVRLGMFLIPTFLIAQITLEFHRPSTMDYAQFMFALVGLLIGISDRGASNVPQETRVGEMSVLVESAR